MTSKSVLSPLFRLPMSQNVIDGSTLSVSATVLMMEMSAWKKLDTTTPARTRMVRFCLPKIAPMP